MEKRNKEYLVNITCIKEIDHDHFIAKLNDGSHIKLPLGLARFFMQFKVSFTPLDLKEYIDVFYDSQIEWNDIYDIINYQFVQKNIAFEKGKKPKDKKRTRRLSVSGFSFNITALHEKSKLINAIKLKSILDINIMIYLTLISLIICIAMYFISFKTIKFSYNSAAYYQTYLLICLGCIIHEIGHISACNKFNVKITGVGVGIFFIFLRIFVKIDSEIWEKSKLERAIIDISGIYFQTIYIALLALLTYFYPVAYLGLKGNLYLIILNLCPIFFFDGKWVLIDLLGEKKVLACYIHMVKAKEYTLKKVSIILGLTIYFLFYFLNLCRFFYIGYERARALPYAWNYFWHSIFFFNKSYGYLSYINFILMNAFNLFMSLMIFIILFNIIFSFIGQMIIKIRYKANRE